MNNKFANNLKQLRLANSIHQKEIAELLNITIRQYQRYEKGDSEPNINNLLVLSNYFNVSLDYLTGRSDQQNNSELDDKFKDIYDEMMGNNEYEIIISFHKITKEELKETFLKIENGEFGLMAGSDGGEDSMYNLINFTLDERR